MIAGFAYHSISAPIISDIEKRQGLAIGHFNNKQFGCILFQLKPCNTAFFQLTYKVTALFSQDMPISSTGLFCQCAANTNVCAVINRVHHKSRVNADASASAAENVP